MQPVESAAASLQIALDAVIKADHYMEQIRLIWSLPFTSRVLEKTVCEVPSMYHSTETTLGKVHMILVSVCSWY